MTDEQRVLGLALRIEEQSLLRDPGLRINDNMRHGMRIAAAWIVGRGDAEREAAGLRGPYSSSGTPAADRP